MSYVFFNFYNFTIILFSSYPIISSTRFSERGTLLPLNIKYVKFLIKNIKIRVKRKFKTEKCIKVPYIFNELSIILKYHKPIIQLHCSIHFKNKFEFLKFIILKFFNF